ncbi:MAG: Ig-like domain-containing protein [Pseudomonadota bacterium]|nr:Ig-like domain-containing protein [Pseudomonadota bacterium]
MKRTLALVLVLGACTNGKDTPADGDDTSVGADSGDTDTDTDTDTDVACEATFLSSEPADGATAVYYRDPLKVSFEGDAGTAAFTLTDAGGADVAFATAWDEGNVQAHLTTVLQANTTYTLTVDVCDVSTTSSFTTSSLGTPLTDDPSSLLGRAYVWRLSEARITEPSFLDALASIYLTVPLLIGVTSATSTDIDLLGGVGYHENDGSYTQVMAEETWDFPAGSFDEQPYFEAYADYITVSYDGTPIPIEQFHLSGTFTADGTAIEKGVGSGFGDSRHMGPLLNQPADDYNAVCEIAVKAGVECVPCSDGEPYCLYIVAEDITARWEDGLTLVQVE